MQVCQKTIPTKLILQRQVNDFFIAFITSEKDHKFFFFFCMIKWEGVLTLYIFPSYFLLVVLLRSDNWKMDILKKKTE